MGVEAADNHDEAPLLQTQPAEAEPPFKRTGLLISLNLLNCVLVCNGDQKELALKELRFKGARGG